MEYQQKLTKFLAQYYMNGNQHWKPHGKPLLNKQHSQYHWGRLNREPSTLLFPQISVLKGSKGGGCRSWQKSWFQSKSPFTRKADFNTESNWPSPFHYTQPSTLGPRQASRPGYPSYSIGRKGKFSLVSKDAQINPAPNKYDTTPAYFQVLQTSPSYSIRNRPQGTHQWDSSGNMPGPGLYDHEKGHIACLPSSPSVIIQGIRRPKRHETGPFTTL
ncbi:protein STPG3 isoform X3 [Mauremys mutica]|uniref:protein STPG3 isoform X3 n=1 Tax=Mauremys mutica TaxID=74926 RepID=UPI001D167B1F|nr:protein STPG3 isoform X3 [Mauremys mutica]